MHTLLARSGRAACQIFLRRSVSDDTSKFASLCVYTHNAGILCSTGVLYALARLAAT